MFGPSCKRFFIIKKKYRIQVIRPASKIVMRVRTASLNIVIALPVPTVYRLSGSILNQDKTGVINDPLGQ